MVSLAGSPTRSSNNTLINRYLQNFEDPGALKASSPTKLNLNTPSKLNVNPVFKNLTNKDSTKEVDESDKENSPSSKVFPNKASFQRSSPLKSNIFLQNDSPNKIDSKVSTTKPDERKQDKKVEKNLPFKKVQEDAPVKRLESKISKKIDNKEESSSLISTPKKSITNTFNRNVTSSVKQNPFIVSDDAAPNATPRKGFFDVGKLTKDEVRYYEFLCRVGEIKKWMEQVIEEKLPSEVEICTGDCMRNGIYLAKMTQKINPDLVPKMFIGNNKLEFRHTQNINAFFSLVKHVGVPDSFRFELQDLYNKKNLPQVFETLHILISIINKKWPSETPKLTSLSGILSFKKEDLKKCQKAWPRLRDFKSLALNSDESPNNKQRLPKKSGLISDFNSYQDLHSELAEPAQIKSTLNSLSRHDTTVEIYEDEDEDDDETELLEEEVEEDDSEENEDLAEEYNDVENTKEEEEIDTQYEESLLPSSGVEETEFDNNSDLSLDDKSDTSISEHLAESSHVNDIQNTVVYKSTVPAEKHSLHRSPLRTDDKVTDISPIRHDPKYTNLDYSKENFNSKYTPMKYQDDDIEIPENYSPSYSPLSSASKRYSYRSPNISRYLVHDSDFYLKRSQERANELFKRKSMDYTPMSYRSHYSPRKSYASNTYSLKRQSELSDYSLRRYADREDIGPRVHVNSDEYSPRKKERMTEIEFLEQVVKTQALTRGVNLRFNINMQIRLSHLFERETIQLQSNIRGHLSRQKFNINSPMTISTEEHAGITLLQSIISASNIRKSLDKLKFNLMKNEQCLLQLQSHIRARSMRLKYKDELTRNEIATMPIIQLQGIIKGKQIRSSRNNNTLFDKSHINRVKQFQAIIRKNFVKSELESKLTPINRSIVNKVCKLQALIRGRKVLNQYNNTISKSRKYSRQASKLSALIKGQQTRKAQKLLKLKSEDNVEGFSKLQARVRGILVRYALDLVDDIIEHNALPQLQAVIKGKQQRKAHANRRQYFRRNERSVIVIQKHLRAYFQRSAYLDLITSPNPSLWSVRKFAHLLNGQGSIEEIQNELEKAQAGIDAENLRKEKLEEDIREQQDLGLVLDKFNLGKGALNDSIRINTSNSKYPGFDKLFYLLQVDCTYWKTLYSKDHGFVENNVYVTFSTVNQRMGNREKMYFIKFVGEIMYNEIMDATSIKTFFVGEYHFWQQLLKTFLQREYAESFSIFLPILDYMSDPRIEFISDPSSIFRNLHGTHPASRSIAIEDEQTKDKFIENLRNLWHVVEMVAEIFTKRIKTVPIEVRYICTKIFNHIADKNAGELDSLRAISKVLINTFVFEFLQNRSHYGYIDEEHHAMEEKITVVLHALVNVFSMKKFTGYYDPLNQYADEIRPLIDSVLFNSLINPDYEQHIECLVYTDMITESPSLEILSDKVIGITERFIENKAYFDEDDPIHDILKLCITDTKTAKAGRIILELNASCYRFLVSDDRTRKIYDQVKRAFVYMMQVEEVDTNLYDLAISQVLPQDEPNFVSLIENNPNMMDDPLLRKLESPLYFNLKKAALQMIHELEGMGTIKVSNSKFQNFLNDIANTVKNPSYGVTYVEEELQLTNNTFRKLVKHNSSLNTKFSKLQSSMNIAINKIEVKKQEPTSPGKSALGGLYKKVHHKGAPGAIEVKLSSRQLYEKGVLKAIKGERVGEHSVKVFGSSGPKFPDIIFKISTTDAMHFNIRVSDKRKGPLKKIHDQVDAFTFADLLKAQVGKKTKEWELFSGKVTLNTSNLLAFVVRNFVR